MGVSTRLTQKRHQVRAIIVAALVAFPHFGYSLLANTNFKDPQPEKSKPLTSVTTAIAVVAPGAEKLELSGRFKQDSTNYSDSIDWIVKSSEGAVVFVGASQVLSLALKPGTYQVSGHYGNASVAEAITLPPDTAVSINFVLNAGALRVAPHLTGESAAPQPIDINFFTDTGQLIKTRVAAGEPVKLFAGTYRVETIYPSGNVVASTIVEVKAGITRAVDISLHAGVVEFPLLSGGAVWIVTSNTGEKIILLPSQTDAALTPGAYLAEAKLGNRLFSKSFTVQDGQSQRLTLD